MVRLTESFDTGDGLVRWAALGDGPAVVLTHGTPFSSFVWRDIARALAVSHRVFVWDLLGYGASDQAEGQDMSIGAQARVLSALLDHWQLNEPALVGHDFGGAITLRALLIHERRARRLALVDPVALAPWGTGFFRLAREHIEVFAALPALHHEAMLRAHVATAAATPLRPAVLDALVAPWLGPTGQAAYYRNIAQNHEGFTDEIEPRYAEVEVPTLVVWGEQDAWIPLADGQRLHEQLPTSHLRTIPGAGHLVQEDAPATLAAELARFIA
jgi:pimeloyl-ACP methyl ester carboxylesterase